MFITILLLNAFLMEGIGSYISVIGLSSLFSGDWVIMLMAIILDVTKITTVSFLYQHWSDINRIMRYYLSASVLILMLITSAGSFGYLSAAFQRAVQPNLEVTLRVDALSHQQDSLESEKKELTASKLSINKQIADIPTENERSRRQLISSMKPELERTSKRLDVVNVQLDEIRSKLLSSKNENIEKDVHAGPITYVSKAFGISLEDSSKYIILVIVSVFDPLAVMLVLAANFLIKKKLVSVKPKDEPKIEDIPIVEPIVNDIQPIDVSTCSDVPQSDPLPVRLEKQGMVLK